MKQRATRGYKRKGLINDAKQLRTRYYCRANQSEVDDYNKYMLHTVCEGLLLTVSQNLR